MSYENVPMSVLELAVKASKAAKAEYWACDIAIDENTNKPYILECATAFAAFPYVRDWIGQYIMWDLSGGKFRLPHVPLYSWEELGKMDASILRTLRHLYFAKYEPSADGAYWLADKGNFDMERTEASNSSDVPASIEPPLSEDKLPDMVKGESECTSSKIGETKLYKIENITLTELMTLQGMEEEIALSIKELVDDKKITSFKKLSEYFTDSKEKIGQWSNSFIK